MRTEEEELGHVLLTRVRVESPTAECVDDDTIAALAAGTLAASVRPAVVDHVARCARCRAVVASVSRALGDRAVARELRAAERTTRHRILRIALPMAAAAVLLLLAWPPSLNPPHRGTITGTPGATAMWPVGAVAEARALRWAAVGDADRYRTTLFDAAGRVLYEAEGSDTVVSLPDSVLLVPGRPYLWKVDARTGFDRWVSSDLIEFSVAGAPR